MVQLNLTDLLQYGTDALYLVVFVVSSISAVRRRLRADIDVALLFGAVALIVTITLVPAAVGAKTGPILAALTASLAMVLPYLMLRLVDDFAGVPRNLARAAEAGLILLVVGFFGVPQPYPLWLTVLLVAYFVILEVYAALAFMRAGRRSRGVTRRRMQAVAIGSLFLGLDLLMAGLQAALPSLAAPLTTIGQISALASGLAYLVGFAPPTWLKLIWQTPELWSALRRTATIIRTPDLSAMVADMENGCAEAVGAPNAAIGLWDATNGVLRFVKDGQRFAYPPDKLVCGRAFLTQRAIFSGDLRRENPGLSEVYDSSKATACMMAPITAGKRQLGVLVIYAPRAPIFADDDLDLVRVLADHVAVVLENRALVEETARERARAEALTALDEERRRINLELEERVSQRTNALQEALRELESFSYSVSHDLRAPLRTIDGFVQAFLDDYGSHIDPLGRDYLQRARTASQRMGLLIDGLLRLSRVTRTEMSHEPVDLSEIARGVAADLQVAEPGRRVTFLIADELVATGDDQLLRVVMENLLANAWKFTSKTPAARIEFGASQADGHTVYYVRDNGAGFDMAFADKLFGPFQRLHGRSEFEGSGIGLATVQRIVRRHGGQIRGEGSVGQGATFYFTIGPGLVSAEGGTQSGDLGERSGRESHPVGGG